MPNNNNSLTGVKKHEYKTKYNQGLKPIIQTKAENILCNLIQWSQLKLRSLANYLYIHK